MNKGKGKVYDANRAIAIKWVADKHGVTREYVRAAIYKTSTGGRTEELLKDFHKKYTQLKQILS